MTPRSGHSKTAPAAVLHGSNSPKFCAPAQQRVFLHTRSRISGNFGVIIPQPALMRKRKNAARPGYREATACACPCAFSKKTMDIPPRQTGIPR